MGSIHATLKDLGISEKDKDAKHQLATEILGHEVTSLGTLVKGELVTLRNGLLDRRRALNSPLPVEPPADTDDYGDGMALSKAQLDRLGQLRGDLALSPERLRKAATTLANREIGSATELTYAEATRLIAYLQSALDTGHYAPLEPPKHSTGDQYNIIAGSGISKAEAEDILGHRIESMRSLLFDEANQIIAVILAAQPEGVTA
jgi:hypothetical protein